MKVDRTTIRPTNRAFAILGGAGLLFAVGTNVQAGWVLAIAALLLGILAAGVVLPLSSVRGVEISRHVPRTATAGLPVPVTIGVTNAASRTRGLFRVADDFCGKGWAVVDFVSPGEKREYVAARDGARRGVHVGGNAALETGAPFGVLRVRRSGVIESPIVVYPRTYGVPSRQMWGPSGWHAPAVVGDVSSVRDYRPGDPLRHIHWRSVARRGQLVVREFDRERHADTAVVARLPGDPDVGDAIASVACSLAIGALSGGEVKLVGSGAASPERARSSERVLEWGARLVPTADSTRILDGLAAESAVVYVGPAQTPDIDRLCELAATTSVLVVLIAQDGAFAPPRDEAGPAATRAVQRLTSAGASVAQLRPSEVEAWFSSGCAVA